MDRTVNIGIIGCGFFARNHLHAWQDLASEGARLAAVCDIDAGKAQRAAEAFGVPHWYTDPAEMFAKENLGLVEVITQMGTHRPLVEAAVARGIPTVVQKPMAPEIADCRAMVAAADKAGVFLAVHENFRFQAPMLRVKEIIDSGEIGKPNWARVAFRTGFDIYTNQPYFYTDPRLVLIDVGIHVLDLSRFFLGEVAHLSCETQRRNPKVRAEDSATALLRHTSGAVSLAECTYENRRTELLEMLVEIEAERGGLTLEPGGAMTVFTPAGTRHEEFSTDLAWATPPFGIVQESVRTTCRHMLDRLRAGKDADTSGKDNLKTFALVEAAYQAAASHRVVEPAP